MNESNPHYPTDSETAEDACVVSCEAPTSDAAEGDAQDLKNPDVDAAQSEEQEIPPCEVHTSQMLGRVDRVLENQDEIRSQLQALQSMFEARIQYTAHEERIVDQMHCELQKYKEDLYAQLVRPILMDVIEVRDSIIRMSAAFEVKPVEEQNIPLKTFSDYTYDLQDILERNAVEIYRGSPGESFRPIEQKIIKKVATNDEALHGKVAQSLSNGYRYNGRILSPEKVVAYVYEAPVLPTELPVMEQKEPTNAPTNEAANDVANEAANQQEMTNQNERIEE